MFTTPETPQRGFILDCFSGTQAGKAVIFIVGKLESGETFGIVDTRFTPVLYVRLSDQPRVQELTQRHQVNLRPTELYAMDGEGVVAIEAAVPGTIRQVNWLLRDAKIDTFEGDTDYAYDYLKYHRLRGSLEISGTWRSSEQVGRVYTNPDVKTSDWVPQLRVLAFDIETNILTDEVIAVSLVTFLTTANATYAGDETSVEEVFITTSKTAEFPEHVKKVSRERDLLATVATRIKELDPDVVTGWNIIDFDLPVLARRFEYHKIPWDLGRSRAESKGVNERFIEIKGRQILDGLRLVRSSALHFEDMKLETVAQTLLGRGKSIGSAEGENRALALLESYKQDPLQFAEYCLDDSRLVRDILRKEPLIELTINRSLLVGLPLSKSWGSVVAFELIYMTELRQRGYVAPTRGLKSHSYANVAGGLVLEPTPGLYDHVWVFDFRSLYPSLIRTFNIDPLAHAKATARFKESTNDDVVTAPNNAVFERTPGILPTVLDRFFTSRAEAQKRGDSVASYAYKIIMNSFYGVMGTDACRFAAPSLAGGITSFGHLILKWTRRRFEDKGYEVLYGDTDSLFVAATGEGLDTAVDYLKRGEKLATEINQELEAYISDKYQVQSRLELQFEKYYRKMLLPNSRGGTSKAKSYAGTRCSIKGGTTEFKLEIKGMEAVRSDWTVLGRNLQRELLDLLLRDAPAGELERLVRQTVDSVMRGEKDHELVYRKVIRKDLASYTKTTPPQVKAARLLPYPTRTVRYLMTKAGPQPVDYLTSEVDYDHYIKKQVMPIVDPVAELAGFDAASTYRLSKPKGLFGD